MSMQSFRLALEDGVVYRVYLTRVDGHDIPVDRQRPVFSSRALSKAQAVCDALNSGVLRAIGRATAAERERQKENA